jgi:hypothetical protein
LKSSEDLKEAKMNNFWLLCSLVTIFLASQVIGGSIGDNSHDEVTLPSEVKIIDTGIRPPNLGCPKGRVLIDNRCLKPSHLPTNA